MDAAMPSLPAWPVLVELLALFIPATLAIGAIAVPRRAALVTTATLGLALAFTLGVALSHGAAAARPDLGVQVDATTCVMLLVVSGIGAVIARYSRTYLDGDPGLARYQRWLSLTLAAVTALVITDNLLVLAAAWTATSLALHQLLTFHADRPAALVAAHKKFLVSRLADVCLVTCLLLVHREVGSLDLDRLAAWAAAHPALTPGMHVAAVLVVVAVALRSAQLPFHGWLMQVMEAPTPVSALLHAGVVNIGGFVLIRLAPWMAHAGAAQLLLVTVGLASAVVAALVMTTRVSVKVALAWSTCAQLGFMLVQCGLGLWHLALLHLAAHSLYKAHAFLSAGAAVEAWRARTLGASPPPPSVGRLVVGALVALGGAALAVGIARATLAAAPPEQAAIGALALLVGLAVAPLVLRPTTGRAVLAARVAGAVALYVGWHVVAARLLPGPPPTTSVMAWSLVGVGFGGLFVAKATLQVRPAGRFARALYPWLYAGLYLDERFTRLTFRLWPPRLAPRAAALGPGAIAEPAEVRA